MNVPLMSQRLKRITYGRILRHLVYANNFINSSLKIINLSILIHKGVGRKISRIGGQLKNQTEI